MLHRGLREKTVDQRDFALGALFIFPKLEELPKEYFVKPLSIKNQIADGNEDHCAACASAGMVEPKEGVELFYPYLFAAAKYVSGSDPESWGLQLRDVCKALQKWGIPEIQDVPESVKNLDVEKRREFSNYPAELREKARLHKAKTYFEVTGPYDAYDNVRAAIYKFRDLKQQVIFGVEFGWSLNDFELIGTPKGFGHAMWISGWYDDGLQCVNSAGKGVGKEGKHKIPREVFNLYAKRFGVFMVVDLPRADAEYMLQNTIVVGDSWLTQLYKVLKTLILSPFLSTQEKIDLVKNTNESLKLISATMKENETPQQALLRVAKENLGKDVTPRDNVPDEVACSEVVSNIIHSIDSTFPIIPFTGDLLLELKKNPKFQGTLDLEAGNIIVNATGTGNNTVRGHTGILLGGGRIASNNSKTGLFEDNYSIESWTNRFRVQGQMPTMVFKKIV